MVDHAKKKLILWDVDGTLIHTGGIAGETMRSAMSKVFGPVSRRERTFYSGKTDRQIIHETFPELTPTAVHAQLSTFTSVYVAEFQLRQGEVLERAGVMPGIQALLSQLQSHAIQAPLTGNVAPIAQLKLAWLGLSAYMQFEIGAYGDDHHDRPALVPIAAERAAHSYRRPFTGADIVIVGDTPHDILCGKHNATRTVAVATGPYSLAALGSYEPDALLADCTDLYAAVDAILG